MSQPHELRRFLEVMSRRRGQFLRTMAAVVIVALGYLMLATPKYEAQALVLVDQAQKNLLESDPLRNALPANNSYVESEVEILRSTAVALDVVSAAGLVEDPEYAPSAGFLVSLGEWIGLESAQSLSKDEHTGRVLAEFQESTSINRKGLTYVISVSVESGQPERAAELANLLAQAYIDRQMQAKSDKLFSERDILQSQISALSEESATAQAGQDSEEFQAKLATLSARLDDIETQAQLQVPDSSIVAKALPPIEASAPRGFLILIGAIVCGAALGLTRIYIAEIATDGVTSARQLSELADNPVSAIIPKVGRILWFQPPVADQVKLRPLSSYSEGVRQLKAALDQWFDFLPQPGERSGRVILTSSSVAGEGKTTIALSLARVYAQAGYRTVLIDADLRKPRVHHYAGADAKGGLAEYLRNADTAELPLIEAYEPNLSVILGRGDAKQPTEDLVNSAAFTDLLAQARQDNDVVIIDSPPLMQAADARYLARHADAIVFAVKHADTAQSIVRNTAETLTEAMPLEASLFPVLNQYGARQPNYGYDSNQAVGQMVPSADERPLKPTRV